MRRKLRSRQMMDTLERRELLATVAVANLNDSGPGSLRQAIADASDGDTIDLTGLSGTIVLSTHITVDRVVTIDGPGAGVLAISGNDSTQLFYQDTSPGASPVLVRNLTIRDGSSQYVGGWQVDRGRSHFQGVHFINNVSEDHNGGAFGVNSWNSAATFEQCEFVNNAASFGGGAIETFADLTITDSTFYNNSVHREGYLDPDPHFGGWMPASTAGGAVLITQGTLTITNSTFVGNSATAVGTGGIASGGALSIWNHAAATITNTTFTNNTVSAETTIGAGVSFGGNGSRVLRNTLISENTGSDDASFSANTSGVNNLIGRMATHANFTHLIDGNLVGSSGSPISAQLGTFDHHGGATRTVALLSGSPAVNAGNDVHAPATDQRGEARVGASDIGAYELLSTNAAPVWSTSTLHNATAGSSYGFTVEASDADADPITFASVTLPAWLTLMDHGDGTATLSATPTRSHIGSHTVTLSISDGADTVERTFTLMVADPNVAPAWSTSTVTGAMLNLPYTQTISATDANGDTLAFSIVSGPSWLTIQPGGATHALLGGTPSSLDHLRASVNATIRVSDGITQVDRTFTFAVGLIASTVADGVLTINGTRQADDIRVWVRNGDQIRIVRNGAIRNHPLAGVNRVVVNLFDANDVAELVVREVPVWVSGGPGDDTLTTGAGADSIYGDAGNDRLFGMEGDDRLYGGDDHDYIDVGSGRNRAWGGAGNDTLIGGNSIDRLWGDDGDDTLIGRGGADLLYGGAGTDTADHDTDDTRELIDLLQ